jgi:hypothetical protein
MTRWKHTVARAALVIEMVACAAEYAAREFQLHPQLNGSVD